MVTPYQCVTKCIVNYLNYKDIQDYYYRKLGYNFSNGSANVDKIVPISSKIDIMLTWRLISKFIRSVPVELRYSICDDFISFTHLLERILKVNYCLKFHNAHLR